MKPLRVGRIVTNPFTENEAEIVYVTDKGVCLRDTDLPSTSSEYDFVPIEKMADIPFTVEDIK